MKKRKFQSTKYFDNFSVAVRQHKAQHSHCHLLHGYAYEFKVWFESIEELEENQLDSMNWIVDFGIFSRNGLKDWMNNMFDHTVLIEKDDPMRPLFEEFPQYKVGKVHFLEKAGAESIAKLVFEKFNEVFSNTEGGRIKVVKVECFENSKNSAIYLEE